MGKFGTGEERGREGEQAVGKDVLGVVGVLEVPSAARWRETPRVKLFDVDIFGRMWMGRVGEGVRGGRREGEQGKTC